MFYDKSKTIREKNNPESTLVAISYNNIGLIYKAKGDLKQALAYLEQSLDIKRRRNVDEEGTFIITFLQIIKKFILINNFYF